MPVPEGYELPAARARMEWAKELLMSEPFQYAIQMLNERTVEEIAETGPLDNDLRTVLSLRLRLISELQSEIVGFIDEYETIRAIKALDEPEEEAVNG
jgi:hypothetical protein